MSWCVFTGCNSTISCGGTGGLLSPCTSPSPFNPPRTSSLRPGAVIPAGACPVCPGPVSFTSPSPLCSSAVNPSRTSSLSPRTSMRSRSLR
ncbi:uncharacterized protein LOC115456157 isoform X2 [Manduca sexta]|uniref:uncharacterized protein LOC115456157 isoform X2 n=1 Tax=Manduca sexta TaxID=7130 RepID=UPI0018901EA8|nr:uncharacterized protein LOC115456157 isoform X2 [Manduca sexta]